MTAIRRAFSMVEVLIMVLIIGIGASLVVPRLSRRTPSTEWPVIENELNALLYFARQESITTQKVHRIVFDKRQRSVEVEVDEGEGKPGERIFKPTQSFYLSSRYELPDRVEFSAARMGRKDLFADSRGVARCYVMPHGLVQEISITVVRFDHEGENSRTFVVEPFLGSFRLQEDRNA